jgi:thiosulfate/3-mercaptopyruvate sulfurtransferase
MKKPIIAALLAALAPFCATAGKLPGPVVDAQWFKDHVSHVSLIDVRDDLDTWTTAPEYEKDPKSGKDKLVATGGHIDGALPLLFKQARVDVVVDGKKVEKMLPDKAYWQNLMQTIGVARNKPIVITSPGESPDQLDAAARIYWTLKVYGADDIALLDGGNAAWIAAGLPVSTARQEVTRGDWEAAEPRGDLVAGMADVSKALNEKTQLIDARPVSQFLGVAVRKPAVTVGGHLNGARNYPTDLRSRQTGIAQMFLEPAEYRLAMNAQQIDPAAPTIAYCNTGHMAAGMWFIQSEILGTRGVRLYDGSMHEWTTMGHPVVMLGN